MKRILLLTIGMVACVSAEGEKDPPSLKPSHSTLAERRPRVPVGTLSGVLTEEDYAESRARLLSQPKPPAIGFTGLYPLSQDRAKARLASLAMRASQRPFEGAPPAMTHSTRYSSTQSCLDCHLDGMRVGRLISHPMPHPVLADCEQCHVEYRSEFYDEGSAPENTFEGLFSPVSRSVPVAPIGGSPPMIPHGTFMRTKCLSCHGEFGYPGLRTKHVDRLSCMQCHIAAIGR